MSKLVAAKIQDGDLLDWLESKESTSDVIRMALIQYRRDEVFSEEIIQALKGIDEKLDKILSIYPEEIKRA